MDENEPGFYILSGKKLEEFLDELGKVLEPVFEQRARDDISEEDQTKLFDELRTRGIDIQTLGGIAPVQAEGLIDGKAFYFRSRWDSWSLTIGRDKREESIWEEGVWFYEENYGESQFDASWILNKEAIEFILKAIERYRSESKNTGP